MLRGARRTTMCMAGIKKSGAKESARRVCERAAERCEKSGRLCIRRELMAARLACANGSASGVG